MSRRRLLKWSGVLCALVLLTADRAIADDGQFLRVMTFNLWHGGDAGKQPLEQTARVIREAKADVVGLQETAGLAANGKSRPDRAAELAKLLGWNYVDQGGRTGIISRYSLGSATPEKWGVKVGHPGERAIYHFNAHLMYIPYQPYQLLEIPYGKYPFLKTESEAIQAARDARGAQVEWLLADIATIQDEAAMIFVTGDFNEPSHLDWTPAAYKAGLCPVPVLWPSTKAIVESGFKDTYRSIHPDPVKDRGLTWTPTTKIDDPKDRHDRIDFILMKGPGAVTASQILGESLKTSDIVVTPYPSDHRAVVSTIRLE